MAEIANLITIITADTAQFTAAVNKAKGEAQSMTSSIKAGSVIAVAAFAAVAGAAIWVGDEILKTAEKVSELYTNTKKIGLSVAAFQELAIAARETGVSTEGLQNALGFMEKNLGKAELGTGTAVNALKALGLTFNDLKNLSPDRQFELIASKLRQIKDINVEQAVGADIFGKKFRDVLGLVNSDIDKTVSKVQGLGITLTDSQAEGLHKLTETKDLIGSIWEGFKDNVAADVAPAFQILADGIIKSIKAMGGMKDAAKSTADFIASAMAGMAKAVSAAAETIKFASYLISHTPEWKLASGLINGNGGNGVSTVKNITADDYKRNQGQDAATQSAVQETLAARMLGAQTDLTGQALSAYKDTTKETAKALEILKKNAEAAAEVMDSFHAIKDELNAPGKNQASTLAKEAANNANNFSPLANVHEEQANGRTFQGIYNEIVLLRQSSGKFQDVLGNTQKDIPTLLKQLQAVIDHDSSHPAVIGGGGDTGQALKYSENNQDTSGLVTALNELKVYLAQKSSPQQQTVDVKIKVAASPEFVTTVTKDITFKQAVDEQFRDSTAAAARGVDLQ